MNLKQQTGDVRHLLNPTTGEGDTLKKETLNEAQARPRQAGVRSASPGISIASGLNPAGWQAFCAMPPTASRVIFLSLPKRWKNVICITPRCCAPAS
ncbi:hypothetical protein [Escherichia coli]|uniref:hypothetical protein n=1 Tax=Escherichia coli TaxID=562 RepID=UPI0039A66E27